jgi:4-amino-4-deoxy-L-arabinose transferase-like glycosyltransferase
MSAVNKLRVWLDSWRGLVLLAFAAFGLRFFRLAFRSIWLDEAYSIKLAGASLKGIWNGAGMDIHPPLYHVLLSGWMHLFGTSETAVRSLSVVAGALLVPVVFKLAEALTQRRAAWWSAGLVTVSPFFVELSRTARMGAWLALFSGLALYFFWKFFRSGSIGHATGFVLSMLAAIYTHYFGFLVFFSIHLFLFMGIGKLAKPRPWRMRWMFLQLNILVGFTPWLPKLWDHMHKGGPAWRGAGVGWLEPLHTFYGVVVGTACWSVLDKALVMTAFALVLGLVLLTLIPRREEVHASLPPEHWGFIMTCLLVPIGIVLMYSWNRLNVFDERYLSVVGIMLLLLAGLAFSKLSLRRAWMTVPLLALGLGLPLANQWFVYGYYDNWRAVAQQLNASVQGSERVAVVPAWNETPLAYYMNESIALQGLPGTYDPVSGETQNYFPIDPMNVHHLQSIFKPEERVWLVLVNEGEEQSLIQAWFASTHRLASEKNYGGIRVEQWEKP